MIGYSNSLTASLHQRAEDLRQAAAHQAAARAATSERRRTARRAADARQFQRDQRAAFSWESHRVYQIAAARLPGRSR